MYTHIVRALGKAAADFFFGARGDERLLFGALGGYMQMTCSSLRRSLTDASMELFSY
jgi:hypothetical protein